MSENAKTYHKWEAVDDGKKLQFNSPPEDKNGLNGIALEPQRIRSFMISYNGAEKIGQNSQYK